MRFPFAHPPIQMTVGHCQVLPQGGLGIILQSVLGIVSLASLVIKYKITSAGRTLAQYCNDSVKQVVGAFVLHILNMSFASMLAQDLPENDECSWYLMQNLADTTIGVAVAFAILHMSLRILRKCGQKKLVGEIVASERVKVLDDQVQRLLDEERQNPGDSGVKGLLPRVLNDRMLLIQVTFWTSCVIAMKFCMLGFLLLFRSSLMSIGQDIFKEPDRQELVVVMIVVPLFTDLFQYWLFDNIFLDAFASHMKRAWFEKQEAEIEKLRDIIVRNGNLLQDDKEAQVLIRNLDRHKEKKPILASFEPILPPLLVPAPAILDDWEDFWGDASPARAEDAGRDSFAMA